MLYSHFGVTGVVSMVSGVLLLMSIAIVALRVETSNQTLEAIAPDIELLYAEPADPANSTDLGMQHEQPS